MQKFIEQMMREENIHDSREMGRIFSSFRKAFAEQKAYMREEEDHAKEAIRLAEITQLLNLVLSRYDWDEGGNREAIPPDLTKPVKFLSEEYVSFDGKIQAGFLKENAQREQKYLDAARNLGHAWNQFRDAKQDLLCSLTGNQIIELCQVTSAGRKRIEEN